MMLNLRGLSQFFKCRHRIFKWATVASHYSVSVSMLCALTFRNLYSAVKHPDNQLTKLTIIFPGSIHRFFGWHSAQQRYIVWTQPNTCRDDRVGPF